MTFIAADDDFTKALVLADEIEAAWRSGEESGWFDSPWEHLGDADRDVRVLIRGLRAAATRPPAEASE